MRIQDTLTKLVALTLALFTVACGPTPPPPGAGGAKGIGMAGPLTGPSAQFGLQMRRGADLAISEINAAGGLHGAQVTAVYEDDAANPREAGSVAQKLASNPNVYAVVGHFNSSCSLAGKPKYAEGKVLQLTPASTNVKVCKGSDWTFRNIYDDAFQGQTLARYAKEVLKLERVAVFFDNDDYGIGLKDSFVEQANKDGLNVVFIQTYSRDTTDYRPHLSGFAKLKPQAIMVAGLFEAAAKIARQARELGIDAPLLAGDGVFSDKYIDLAQKAAENTYISTPFLFRAGQAKEEAFKSAYQKMFSQDAAKCAADPSQCENPDAWAALAYDAVKIVAEGVKAKGWDRVGIRDYVAGLNAADKAFPGVTGPTFFDAHGDCKKPVTMAVVKGGKMTPAPQLQ